MTTKTARKTPASTNVVALKNVNLDQMERVLTEAAQQQAPMLSRAATAKAKKEAEVSALLAERKDIIARRDLCQRYFEELMRGFESELSDVDLALVEYGHEPDGAGE